MSLLIESDRMLRRTTNVCPTTTDDRSERRNEIRCYNGSKYYCVKTVNYSLLEFCGSPLYFIPKHGCPIYNGSIDLLYDKCTLEKGCPPQYSEKKIPLTDLFTFPACIRFSKEIPNVPNHPSVGRFTSKLQTTLSTTEISQTIGRTYATTEISDHSDTTETSLFGDPVIKTAGIVISVSVLGNIIIVVVVVKMIKVRDRRIKNVNITTTEALNGGEDQIYDSVNEACMEETV